MKVKDALDDYKSRMRDAADAGKLVTVAYYGHVATIDALYDIILYCEDLRSDIAKLKAEVASLKGSARF